MILYLKCWLISAFIFSIIAITPFPYINKFDSQLSSLEYKILYNKANFKDRFLMLTINLFSSIIAPPVYIFALIIYFVALVITKIF